MFNYLIVELVSEILIVLCFRIWSSVIFLVKIILFGYHKSGDENRMCLLFAKLEDHVH